MHNKRPAFIVGARLNGNKTGVRRRALRSKHRTVHVRNFSPQKHDRDK